VQMPSLAAPVHQVRKSSVSFH